MKVLAVWLATCSVVIGGAALVACSAKVQDTGGNSVEKPEGVYLSDGGGSAFVTEVTMPSGTKCVVLVGYQKGALDCAF
jgi:hypothetical protein